ncbi:MAG: DUF1598 domain-containing protein [Planctomycetaceae bacterium]|jgi:hypothetical protein|nr:DUF1598 domain-containing protein [Planctomycetaceae bacterium]
MNFRKLTTTLLTLFLVWAFAAATTGMISIYAQTNSSTSNNDNNDSNSNYSGVRIDPNGVLRRDYTLDYGRVNEQYLNSARATYSQLPKDVQRKSLIRYLSLNRLEKALIDGNGVVTEEMKYLAGLQRIRYVFYFPESKDIVLAGPAEGWYPGYEGVMMGATSNRPVCELQDLVVALRAYAPGKDAIEVVGCSIDPTEEGNARLQQFQQSFGGYDGPGRREAFVRGLRESLGMQTVRVDGIPASTHAAGVMVAADYRMKQIGIGVEPVPRGVRIDTFISHAEPSGRNALFRWFFVPDYQSVLLTEDRTGMELIGSGVKLVAEDEVVTATGERVVQKGKIDKASKVFSKSFTAEYAKLSQKSLVFAQLRNFVDMLVCAAHIQKEDFYGKTGWSMEFLGNEEKYAVQRFSAPSQVEPVVGSAVRKGLFMAPIGGGVEIEPQIALHPDNAKTEDKGQVTNVRKGVKLELQPGQWWWD